ncbi:MAG: SDR family oxidoreductase [Chloroflexi bacterium]|nr:SDR family oxidoreductase [Chloroflexota bacterium]
MVPRFDGHCAVITGAGGGLGRAIAGILAGDGCQVALWDIDENALRAAVAEIPGETMPITADVAREDSVANATRLTVERFGRIDYLVNCAGVDHTVPVSELTVAEWDHILAVNLRGPFLTTRAVFPIMQRQSGGHIVNIASTAALRAWPNASAYCASKWGLVGFTRAVGTEGRPYHIRATAVIPGGMRTGFFDRPDLPIKPDPSHLNDPINVAQAVAFVLAQPPGSVIQEMLITPLTETSWP